LSRHFRTNHKPIHNNSSATSTSTVSLTSAASSISYNNNKNNRNNGSPYSSSPASPNPRRKSPVNSRGGTNIQSHSSSSFGGGASVQQLYELCFCLWTMTYECEKNIAIRSHFHRDGAVAALCELVALAPREKVVRLALSALRNLATCPTSTTTASSSSSSSHRPPLPPPFVASTTSSSSSSSSNVGGPTFLSEMIECGLIKSVDLLKERQWTDPDIVQGKLYIRMSS
jgi:hypothetical protein